MYLRRRIGSTIFGSLVIFLLILTTSGAGFTYAIDSSYDDQPAIIETESPYHTPPQDVVVTRQHSGNQILMYNTFEARDEALKTLPDASIGIVYQLIPAIAVRNIDPQDITKANLVSITPDMKFQRQANSEETISIDRIATDVGAFSLAQTAQMIGVNYLREVEELTGKGITIAILDSGVNDSLNSFTTVERIVVQDLADSGSEDLDGHGTHVTGIAAGNGNFFLDGKWVETDSTGMAPEASILSVRVLDDIGVGDNSWILEGIEKAILAGVDIISMSLSTVLYEGPNDPMQRMVDMAIANGTVVVAAAGNTGPIGSAIGIPGALDGVIAVGASFPQNVEQQELWSFSGIGPATNEYPGPDFIAPGAKILSVNAGTGELRQLSGTSMAAPHVSGGIALLMQKFPQATGNQIREALMASSQLSFNSFGALDQVEGQGRGHVRLDLAMFYLQEILSNPEHIEMPVIPQVVRDSNFIYRHRIIGESRSLPFYIFSSRNTTLTPIVNSTFTEGMVIELPSSVDLIEGMNRIDITSTITSRNVNFTRGQVYFVDDLTGNILPNAYIFFESRSRYLESRVLFDTSHDLDTNGSYFGNHGPLGQFSQFSSLLEESGHFISASGSQQITPSLLSDYDLLVIANPDREYTDLEISAIRGFKQAGNPIFVIVSGGLLSAEGLPTYPNFNSAALNAILDQTGISIPTDINSPFSLSPCDFEDATYLERATSCTQEAQITSSQNIIDSSISYTHFGPELELSGDASALAFADGEVVAAFSEQSPSGRVVVFSSMLQFDNNAMMYDYPGSHTVETNKELVLGAIDWLIEPLQAKMIVKVNGETGVDFDLDMYKDYVIELFPQDNTGNPLDLGSSILVNLQENHPTNGIFYDNVPFVKIESGAYAILLNLPVNTEFEFYFHLSPDDSIPTDSHFVLSFDLRNFENQQNLQKIGFTMFLLIFVSWVFWITNEGGRELWLRQLKEKEELEAQQ